MMYTITIDEAIDYIDTLAKDLEFRGYHSEARALRIGIEALKAWQEHRRVMGYPELWILPGETI